VSHEPASIAIAMSRRRRPAHGPSVRVLLTTEAAVEKLGARGISIDEVLQLPGNRHATIRNRGQLDLLARRRRLLIGRTNGGRVLTLVIQQTIDPAMWLIVTGWRATSSEARIIGD
jgi:hypothetical protein